MGKLREAFSIGINNIRKWFTNPRIYILAILLIILVLTYIRPLYNFSEYAGYRVTVWMFPFISNFYITQFMMMLGIVFLFCDAPFIDICQPYQLIRSGRTVWGIGQVFYIMLSSALYFLFIAFLSILVLFPNVFISNDWGKVMGTLAQADIGRSFGIYLPIDYQILTMYNPLQAFGLSILLDWCAGTMLGLIIFITNINFNRAIGAILASAVVILDISITNAFPYYLYHFSPVSMARLTIIDPSGFSTRPSSVYTFIFFFTGLIVLSVVAVLSARKHDIQVLPPI